MACLLRKQLHCLQASQLVLMNEIPEFRSAGLFIRGINLPRLCKGRTIQSFNSVTSVFFFWTVSEELCEHEGACAKKLGKNSQVKKKSKHASERRASSKTCYAQQSAKHAFCASVRNILSHAMDGQRTEKEAAFSWIFFFFGTKHSLSPRGRNILLLLGYLVKNVWARESEEWLWGVAQNTFAQCVAGATWTPLPQASFPPSFVRLSALNQPLSRFWWRWHSASTPSRIFFKAPILLLTILPMHSKFVVR